MTISSALAPQAGASPTADRPKTPEEAAEQFEAVLVRQFVEAMTDGLFESASGSAPQAQIDAQRDALTTALTDELVESGTLRFRDLLMQQWGREGAVDAPAESAPPAGHPAPRPSAAPRPASGDDHFELLRQAAELGKSARRA